MVGFGLGCSDVEWSDGRMWGILESGVWPGEIWGCFYVVLQGLGDVE